MENKLLKRVIYSNFLIKYMEEKLSQLGIIGKNLSIKELVNTYINYFVENDDDWDFILSL